MGTITQKTFHQSTSDLFFFPHHKSQPPHLQHPKKSAVIQVLCEMKQFVIIASLLAAAAATPDLLIHRGGESPLHGHEHAHNNRLAQSVLGRQGRQAGGAVTGGVDFSNCQTDPDTGLCCVEKEETVTSIQKDPILECTHRNVEKCHYTYVTQFEPAQEEICEENFEKSCQITFKQQATEETVKKSTVPWRRSATDPAPRSAVPSTNLAAPPATSRSNQASSSETPLVKNSLSKFAVLDAPPTKDPKSATIRSSHLSSMSPRRFVT